MKILITGADGFLGSAVVQRLQGRHNEVLSVTRRPQKKDGAIECDLNNPLSLSKLLQKIKPNCVVNLAAKVVFGQVDMADLYPINALCPAIIADYCRKHDAHIIQASSSIVSGFHNTQFCIDTPDHPDTSYGASKLLGEKMINASECTSTIIRFGGIFGQNGPEHLGINRAIKNAQNHIIPRISVRGSVKRNYVFVDDAAAMIEKSISNRLRGVFMAGGETISMADMLQAICDEWLPGESPTTDIYSESHDQIIEVSPEFKIYHPFKDCLRACHR
jgi:nucleoside-diphosphate-sugar epimerase